MVLGHLISAKTIPSPHPVRVIYPRWFGYPIDAHLDFKFAAVLIEQFSSLLEGLRLGIEWDQYAVGLSIGAQI
jgi:hypothetical protein